MSAFRWEIVVIAFPKLAYVALSLSQPFLIQEAVGFVQNAGTGKDQNIGYGLIGGFALVYIGLAVSASPFPLAPRELTNSLCSDYHGRVIAPQL